MSWKGVRRRQNADAPGVVDNILPPLDYFIDALVGGATRQVQQNSVRVDNGENHQNLNVVGVEQDLPRRRWNADVPADFGDFVPIQDSVVESPEDSGRALEPQSPVEEGARSNNLVTSLGSDSAQQVSWVDRELRNRTSLPGEGSGIGISS